MDLIMKSIEAPLLKGMKRWCTAWESEKIEVRSKYLGLHPVNMRIIDVCGENCKYLTVRSLESQKYGFNVDISHLPFSDRMDLKMMVIPRDICFDFLKKNYMEAFFPNLNSGKLMVNKKEVKRLVSQYVIYHKDRLPDIKTLSK